MSGHILCAHFRILYPIPLKPGAEELDVVERARVTSSGDIGSHALGG
jgi:hypothetical protein